LEQYKEAIDNITKAIEITPKESNYYCMRALNKTNLKDYKGAIKDYNKAIKLNPKEVEYYFFRGNVKDNMGNYKDAINDYSKAIKLNPNYVYAYYLRASKKYYLKDYQGAIYDYTSTIKLDNTYTLAYVEKAKLIFENNQNEALELLLTALENCENDKDNIFTALSFVYFSQNDYKKALKYADESILFNKDNGTGYYRKHCALKALGKQDEAREALEKANALGYEETF
jgi:tetratricopeptide (TPR) repeat protein